MHRTDLAPLSAVPVPFAGVIYEMHFHAAV